MAVRFSDETKRNIWIVVAAGVVIAFVSGTWGMLQHIFNDGEDAPVQAQSSLTTPSGATPEEVRDWFSVDLGNLGRPYPTTTTPPTVEELLPQVQGSTFVSGDDSMLTIEYPATYVDPGEDADATTYAVYRRGDIAALEALRWRCDWAQAFVEAGANGDEQGMTQAREQLEAFPDLLAVEGLPVAKQNAEELEPVLVGDSASGERWLRDKCGR